MKSKGNPLISSLMSLVLVVGLTPAANAYADDITSGTISNDSEQTTIVSDQPTENSLVYIPESSSNKYTVHGQGIYYDEASSSVKPSDKIYDLTVERYDNGKLIKKIVYKSESPLDISINKNINMIKSISAKENMAIEIADYNTNGYSEIIDSTSYKFNNSSIVVNIDDTKTCLPEECDSSVSKTSFDGRTTNLTVYNKDSNGIGTYDTYVNSEDKNIKIIDYDSNGLPLNISNYTDRTKISYDSNNKITYYLISSTIDGKVVSREFNGANLTMNSGFISNFSSMCISNGSSITEFVSNDFNGRTSVYEVSDVSGVNLVRKSASGDTRTVYDSTDYIVVKMNNNGTIKNAIDSLGYVVKPIGGLYEVVFKNWDGTIIDKQKIYFGDGATAPATPSRSGYNFSGWDTPYDVVTADEVVTAKFTKIVKKANPITVKSKNLNLKKSKKARTFKISNVLAVSKAQGKVTYKKLSGSSKKLSISGNKVKVTKNSSGKLKLIVQVKAAGNTYYKAKTVKKTLYIKIK